MKSSNEVVVGKSDLTDDTESKALRSDGDDPTRPFYLPYMFAPPIESTWPAHGGGSSLLPSRRHFVPFIIASHPRPAKLTSGCLDMVCMLPFAQSSGMQDKKENPHVLEQHLLAMQKMITLQTPFFDPGVLTHRADLARSMTKVHLI
jgi:hypothetical protein